MALKRIILLNYVGVKQRVKCAVSKRTVKINIVFSGASCLYRRPQRDWSGVKITRRVGGGGMGCVMKTRFSPVPIRVLTKLTQRI